MNRKKTNQIIIVNSFNFLFEQLFIPIVILIAYETYLGGIYFEITLCVVRELGLGSQSLTHYYTMEYFKYIIWVIFTEDIHHVF